MDLPRDQLIVITGISGSGKSSLAFDTIYAEGQRRYVESLSAYARQFLGQMDKPDVDFIEGLSPAISIDQKSASHNPRSTVGTITEVYDYLRLLYARVGTPYCPKCGNKITQQTTQQIVDQIMSLPQGTRFELLAPVVTGRKGVYEGLLTDLSKQGFVRAYVDGELIELSQYLAQEHEHLARYVLHNIEVVVDRLVIKEGLDKRLSDSVETTLKLAGGLLGIRIVQGELQAATPKTDIRLGDQPVAAGQLVMFSQHMSCNSCGTSFTELAPRSFSFNSPYGACEACDGLGTNYEVDPSLVVPDPSLSISQGAIAPWRSSTSEYFSRLVAGVAESYGFSTSTPFGKLKSSFKDILLYGSGSKRIHVVYRNRFGRQRSWNLPYEGVIPWLTRRRLDVESDFSRQRIESYMREVPCSSCKGARLNSRALAVRIAGMNIFELCEMPVSQSFEVMKTLELSERDKIVAARVLKEINSRLQFLCDVGLDYLSLSRRSATLAGGEAQRIRLASQIGTGLAGVLYVLDEPSIGLHQRDNIRLINTLQHLKSLGNTVIVVEHDAETIRCADWIVDMGQGAGEHGGRVVCNGTLDELLKCKDSLTGRYLTGKLSIPVPKSRRKIKTASKTGKPGAKAGGDWLVLRGGRKHNLKNITVEFPLGCFIAVTGVSGSGKSTLVNDVLYRMLMDEVYGVGSKNFIYGSRSTVAGTDSISEGTTLSGAHLIDKVIDIDQSPIGRTPRSNPATYTGVFDHIRKLFSLTTQAKIRGYGPGRFSFNVRGGRCEACAGEGNIKIEMNFLPDVYVPCESCNGARYNRDTLEITFKGLNISGVLNLSCQKALGFFSNQPPIVRCLQTIVDVGLGYVKLGQPAPTLSGGEAQRVKLASELSKRATGHTFYILDEPTTGLHFDDVSKLLGVLSRLVDQGNTVLVIEHNLDVIKTADWVIDLGPEGGHLGGYVVGKGDPETIAKNPKSYTGKFLKKILT
ncbi:MAG: excinuclease ABC subunit UvrA [Actinobacteria bacterium]|nr:excinuclease ABC subunit UvrA [Actinomycetota bacterium]MCL6105294.1 excinuclease ABC subunit UvrA [Actinomycetota bacterium]